MKNEAYLQPIQPSSKVALKVTGDAEATVGLVAVDKAVHILNSKHKFTQKKVRACGLWAKRVPGDSNWSLNFFTY